MATYLHKTHFGKTNYLEAPAHVTPAGWRASPSLAVPSKLKGECCSDKTKAHLSEQIHTCPPPWISLLYIFVMWGHWFHIIKRDFLTFAPLIIPYSDTVPVTVITENIALWVSFGTLLIRVSGSCVIYHAEWVTQRLGEGGGRGGDGAASLFSSAKWETTFNLRNPGV